MSFKYLVPKTNNNPWHDYWNKTSILKEVNSCQTDELWGIIKAYIKPNDKIIDAGCGLGRWVIYLSSKGYNIIGIDNLGEAIDILKKFDKKLKLKIAGVDKLPFPDNSFDTYLSFGVVEHFENGPLDALREAKRVLKKGGIIILETPNDNFIRRLKRLAGILRKLGSQGSLVSNLTFYEYRYQTKELKEFLTSLGFTIMADFSKDLIPDKESIGLWSDFPMLRTKENYPFNLNKLGILIKKLTKPIKFLYAGCTVVVAKKI